MQLVDDTPDEPDVGGPPAGALSTSIARHGQGLVAWLRDVLGIGPGARVIEVASHGNLLAPLLRNAGWRATTVEDHPSAVARARAAGLDVVDGRLTPDVAERLSAGRPADLVLDTFLLSHLRSPGEELAAIATAIGRTGVAVVELDHALPLLEDARFDAIRHGHFSYVSLSALMPAAARAGLALVDAARLPIYGGAIRVVLAAKGTRPVLDSVGQLLAEEADAGISRLALYDAFGPRVADALEAFRGFLVAARGAGRTVAAYGAPTRGNTLLNSAGIGPELISCTADASPAKQGRVMPGSHIPIVSPEAFLAALPDDVIVLTWDIVDEVVERLRAAGAAGCRFVVPMPTLRVLPN